MYKVISANRGSHKAPKNWRVFEKESLEKYFGKVLDVNGEDGFSVFDAYKKYKNDVEYIRWYPCPETCNSSEYEGMVKQNSQINSSLGYLHTMKYLTNSVNGFKSVQSKDVAFKIWKENGVNCPEYFTYTNQEDFLYKYESTNFDFPFLLRVNNQVSGRGTRLVQNASELMNTLPLTDNFLEDQQGSTISPKKLCVQYIDTIDRGRNVNVSYRVHVAGNKVISGYGRVVPSTEWCAITAGMFQKEQIDNWLYYNKLCEEIIKENEEEIVRAVHVLGLNHQGVDLVVDQSNNKVCFLEVQPTYASGYPQEGYCGYVKPFYNPSDPNLVKFLVDNKSSLIKEIPMYYNNWLDKQNHFDMVYKELYEYVWS